MWILPNQLHTSVSALVTEALISDSNEQSQACARWLLVRSKPSHVRTWCLKWNRDSWTRHLSGRILRPSHGQTFVTAWTSSLEVTHVSPSHQPESDLGKTTPDTSGHTSQMELLSCDQGSASLRTSKDISAWGCPTSSKTWQDWVTERRGDYSQRLKSAHRISESGCSSWPSPIASEVRQGFQDRSRGMKGSQESLTTVVVKSWPTPNCMDVITPTRDLTQMESKGHWGKSMNTGKLSEMVNYGPAVPASSSTDGNRPASWPSPSAMDGQRPEETPEKWEQRNAKKKAANPNLGQLHRPLTVAVQSWATPRTGMARGNDFTYDRGKGNIEEQAGASVQGGGKLNPRWVETLMGLPVGWTMPSCASPVTIGQMS